MKKALLALGLVSLSIGLTFLFWYNFWFILGEIHPKLPIFVLLYLGLSVTNNISFVITKLLIKNSK